MRWVGAAPAQRHPHPHPFDNAGPLVGVEAGHVTVRPAAMRPVAGYVRTYVSPAYTPTRPRRSRRPARASGRPEWLIKHVFVDPRPVRRARVRNRREMGRKSDGIRGGLLSPRHAAFITALCRFGRFGRTLDTLSDRHLLPKSKASPACHISDRTRRLGPTRASILLTIPTHPARHPVHPPGSPPFSRTSVPVCICVPGSKRATDG